MRQRKWLQTFAFDPIGRLLSSTDEAVRYFAQKDLLETGDGDFSSLWELPLARSITRRQQPNGAWRYPGGNHQVRAAENYDQIETFRSLGYLVEMFGFDRSSPVIARAAEFLFSCQTSDGDIRGVLGNQYSPYYTAGMAELLVKAGYADDDRIVKIFEWLSSIRQDDGGWAIPLRTHGKKLDALNIDIATLEPIRSKPSSHMVTGVVLRAYAAHPKFRQSQEAKIASVLLKNSLFKRDHYPDRADSSFWLRFTFPFWFTDLLSALDSLTKIGFDDSDPEIQHALQWFVDNQQPTGLWSLKTLKNQKKFNTELWLSLAICRIFKRVYS